MSLVDAALNAVGLQRRSTVQQVGHPRDPVVAEWFGRMASTAAGVDINPDNARECPEVDACVGLIEDTIATVPLDLFERTGPDTRERRSDHPLHQLLHDEPNGWQTSAEFRQMLEGWRNTHANGYARVISTNRGPSALEPVHPNNMRPFRNGDGVAYRWNPEEGGPTRTLLQHEVLHLKGGPPKRSNKFEGDSKVERHRETIGMVQASSIYLARFFGSGGLPKAKLKVPGEMSPEAQDLLQDAWESRHGSLEKARKLAIVTNGLDIEAIGFNNDEAQVVQAHEMGVAKIARIFGVPLHLIGETSKATSWGTGIEQQSIGFITYYMRPKFVVWEQALNRTLMSAGMRSRFFFEFNMDGLLRGDFKTRMEGFALLVQWGLATPNEIRRLMNMAPIEGGNERLHPLNMAPASKIMEVLMRTQSGKSERDMADLATRMLVQIAQAGGVPNFKGQDPSDGN